MNDHHSTPWSRLTAAARRAPLGELDAQADLRAPLGFSARVVARAGLRPASGLFGGIAFERLAARALAFSCACAVAFSLWSALPATAEASPSDTAAISDAYLDPVGAVLEVVQS